MEKHSINYNTTNDGNMLLSLVVLEAIQKDVQIKALNQRLNDLLQHQSPKYIIKTNGDFEAVHSEEFNRLFEKIKQEIEHRQSQIVSAHNWR
jgi:lipid A disaccharide synthetase